MGGNRDDKVVVRYRFADDAPSQDELWTQSTDGRNAFAPVSERPGITARARTANRVVVRVTDPLDGEVKTETFPLNGFTRAVERLSCAAEAARAAQTPPADAHKDGIRPKAP
jgi:hypothetical protein